MHLSSLTREKVRRLYAVSYTHLDVYKRQLHLFANGYKSRTCPSCPRRLQRQKIYFARGYVVWRDCRWPVSYTHLDVYKRQKIPCTNNIRVWWDTDDQTSKWTDKWYLTPISRDEINKMCIRDRALIMPNLKPQEIWKSYIINTSTTNVPRTVATVANLKVIMVTAAAETDEQEKYSLEEVRLLLKLLQMSKGRWKQRLYFLQLG